MASLHALTVTQWIVEPFARHMKSAWCQILDNDLIPWVGAEIDQASQDSVHTLKSLAEMQVEACHGQFAAAAKTIANDARWS